MSVYCHRDDETGFLVAHDEFKLKAFRGDDIENRESWAFSVISGVEKIKSALIMLEEEGMINYLMEFHTLNIDNLPCEQGQLKLVSGTLIHSACGGVIKMKNVKWRLV